MRRPENPGCTSVACLALAIEAATIRCEVALCNCIFFFAIAIARHTSEQPGHTLLPRSRRLWRNLLDASRGPMSLRFILQPSMSAIVGIHEIKDARTGRSRLTVEGNPRERM
jgi:hypothetical protein